MDNKRFEIITRNTVEVLTEDDLNNLLKSKKQLSAYLGIATTGPFHMGYLIPMCKLLDFSKAGIKNKILIADVHSALDDLKSRWEELDKKVEYYKKCIELSFPWDDKPIFVRGSDFQLGKNYQMDVLKMSTISTISRATRAASEVTRMKNPKVSELIYPIMQTLDEEYLKVDIQLGGIDQRHIMAFAREYLPQLSYKQRVEIMTPLVVSLKGPGVKMSASMPETCIKVYESEETIRDKINKAYCPSGISKDNPVLQLTKYVIFPIRGTLKIERNKKFGGDIVYNAYSEIENDFCEKNLHPQDLKNAVSNEIVSMFSKVRKYFENKKDLLKSLGENY